MQIHLMIMKKALLLILMVVVVMLSTKTDVDVKQIPINKIKVINRMRRTDDNNVADLIYGDPTLDWVVLLSNNIVNVQSEWPLSQVDFNRYITEKYDSEEILYSGIHHYESREVKANDGTIIIPSGARVGVGQSVSFYDELSDQQVIRTDVAMPITNFMHEDKLNNQKRSIFLLKPIYLNILFDDIEEIMANKKGSTQFVSRTLVTGDNIRLYS